MLIWWCERKGQMFTLSLGGNENCLCLTGEELWVIYPASLLHLIQLREVLLTRAAVTPSWSTVKKKKISSLEGKFMQRQHKRMNHSCERNQYSNANEVPEVYKAVPCLSDWLWEITWKFSSSLFCQRDISSTFIFQHFWWLRDMMERWQGRNGALGSFIHLKNVCPRSRNLVRENSHLW